jgi:S1-C subfamily serine protease
MKRSLIAASVIILAAGSALTAPCDSESELATEFGVYKSWGTNLTASPVQKIAEDQDIRSIRVLLKHLPIANGEWNLTIRDRAGRPLQNISSRQIGDDEPFWTERLPTNFLEFYVETGGPAPVRGIEYVALSSKAKRPYYSIQGDTPAWKDLFTGTSVPLLLQRRGDSIGMLIGHEGNSVQGMSIWTCTGFVVARDPAVLLVTNDHCGGKTEWAAADRWTSSICRNMVVDFSWDGDSISREYACKEVVARSTENDIAVLRLEAVKREAPPPPLIIRNAPLIDETVSIVHHPAGMSKQASVSCAAMTSAVDKISTVDLSKEFAHRCDTEGGSSGAPVLDSQGHLVGIHHLGFQRPAPDKCDFFSKAVRVRKLIDLLVSKPELIGYRIE